ncbi:Glutathione S-transferase U9 [Acorus gramineus]|uniref:Glutathione S-transferase n=1 Tax=Acorus gramineus TaxID=55184 RepID=A0AAV9AA20_ACOGR|nr:Glutathione S-transferase U9 [Acorus gramineus]
MADVKLYGLWASPYSQRIQLALNLKGVSYEWIEEDAQNKSEKILQYNPIYKKLPVLVHDGKPLPESLIILEYIEETWKNPPLLLPEDPYERSRVRFWANFFDQKVLTLMGAIFSCQGEEQEKAITEFVENITMMEKEIVKDFPAGKPFFSGEKPGFLDVVVGSTSSVIKVLERLVGVKLVDQERTPLVHSWLAAFAELGIAKDTMPDMETFFVKAVEMREKILASTTKN